MLHVIVPGEETKNGEPIERELPHDTIKRLEIYLKTYRPRLSSVPSKMLFPNAQGKQRSPSSFGGGIAKIILRETGLKMHPHLFRHAAAKFHMSKHPEDVETVRRILGHKSHETTMRFYAEMKTDAAFDRYDQVIAGLRDEGQNRIQKPKAVKAQGAFR
jgi:site-specific recombinase XerD